MDIPFIRNQVLEHASSTASVLKATVIWGGRCIQSGFANYLIPAINTAWTHSMQGIRMAMVCLQTSPYTSFSIAGTLFIISLAAFKISESYIYHENLFAKASWKSLSRTALVASTVATSFGIAMITGA